VRSLMLVSTSADQRLRSEVADGRRPTPEYLRLESQHGVQLLDWSELGLRSGHRSVARSLRHVLASLRRVRRADVVFSDGEHLGIPLAITMRLLRMDTAHVMIGHNLLTPMKCRIMRHISLGPHDRVLIHSSNQLRPIVQATGLASERFSTVPYGIDTAFWSPGSEGEVEGLVVSAGREHRDYRTLVEALPAGATATIADHSPYTPEATRRDPGVWPSTVERVALDPIGLRDLYRKAALVVVPVVDSSMPAGITTLLEAMSVGKAVVVTETTELAGVVEHGCTGLTVPPGDVAGMRAAIKTLLADPSKRRALGAAARDVAVSRYDVNLYAEAIARHLDAASNCGPASSAGSAEFSGAEG
jgi:glycosyltransferase involved in cell wall biosynthesis